MRALTLCTGLVFSIAAGCGSADPDAAPGEVTATPATLDFGAVPLEQTASLAFTLTNTGSAPVDVLSVSLGEGDTALWRVDKAGLTVLDGGATAEVTVTFTPDDTGAFAGRVQVRTSSDRTPSLFVALAAEGGESTADDDGDGFSPADGDCDDDDAAVHPGAAERCNGRDDDCDGSVPADESDADFDGVRRCAGDCDDDDEAVYPGAPEICDGKDSDCEGGANDDADVDGDGWSVCDGDCDDDAGAVGPGLAEVCDGLDNDCDGGIDDLDADGDGHSLCSAAGDCDDADPNAFPVVVSPSGSSAGLGTDADPYDTIATALANLDEVCRTVLLAPGTYALEGTFADGPLTIVGTGATPADTEVVPVGAQRILTVGAGGDVTFEHLTLTGGDAAGDGGAVNVANGGRLTLRDVAAIGNTSQTDGGAVAVTSGALTLEGACVFEGNTALDDGGAIAVSSSTFLDRDGTLYQGNSGSQGGALFVSGGTVELVGAELRDNVAADEGGAVAITGAGSYLVERNRIVLNTAAAAGGGLALRDVNDPAGYVRNNEIQDNAAGTVGGGVAVTGTTAATTLVNNTLVGNAASGEGAGVHVAPVAADLLRVWSHVVGWSSGDSGVYVAAGSTASVAWNTGFQTNSGVEFAGAVSVGVDDNVQRDPLLVAVSDDGDPDDDDLSLQVGSPERDAGPPNASLNDLDGTQNDRGATGGPGATP